MTTRDTAIEMLSEKCLRVMDARGEGWLADDVYITGVWAEAERKAEREFRNMTSLAAGIVGEDEWTLMRAASEAAYRKAVSQMAYAQMDADDGAPVYMAARLRERYAHAFVAAFGFGVTRKRLDADVAEELAKVRAARLMAAASNGKEE